MKIAIVGLSFAGSVWGEGLATSGHRVIQEDRHPIKVSLLRCAIAPDRVIHDGRVSVTDHASAASAACGIAGEGLRP